MERKFEFGIDEYYHLYNRGIEKRNLFLNKKDYERFLVLLYIANNNDSVHISNYQGRPLMELFKIQKKESLVSIGSYCLMPNHFHLLVREVREGGISSFMLKLATGYSMYFNKKYQRTGALFEGKFKASPVMNDQYLHYLFAYIHLNPVKLIEGKWKELGIQNTQRAEEYLLSYDFSSYKDFLFSRERPCSVILDKKSFPDYFQDTHEFSSFMHDWIELKSSEPA